MTINLENWGFELIPTVFICILFPLFLYFAGWLFITGIIGLYRMIISKNWNHTIGEVISSEIKFKEFSSNNSTSFKFVNEKLYKYQVDGTQYQSGQNLASDSLYSKEFKTMDSFPLKYGDYRININFIELEKEIKKTIGQKITVYYNPYKPEISCLSIGINYEIFLPIFMGLFFGTSLIYVLWDFMISPIIYF